MPMKIVKILIANAKGFLAAWAVVVIANQLFIFGACFAPYCLIAAIPHTFVITAIGMYYYIKANTSEEKGELASKQISRDLADLRNLSYEGEHEPSNLKPDIIKKSPRFLDLSSTDTLGTVNTEIVRCPKCASGMTLRTAKKGRYSGQKFWGCTKYPECNGIINID
ncbi:topoisomerase DNA-binding C4 zinc finger domain-containing protein [Pseudomonas benzenivorans]|uniref:Topoisomerase DNA-binding C4 zinc finger domain-containing protein n=1 Tax=Pseudomonas benzenivorans TaxID=556533 RepID=A0ABY5H6X1_9PSED|nr:topoisomerase DNA-binding C4 zinc finger domain-containing protein [Pseudomonas benzenivorans]UTW08005.1 topoisomerase DNA-binding C4 zinc finger domain-containing protein [Pseudomonas benzenivorans]